MQKMKKRSPTILEAIFPIIFLIALLSTNVAVFRNASLDGSNQIVLIISSAVASLIALRL